jgi:hypothetical protein
MHQTARSKLDKATALAHARQKATFNPQAYDVLAPRRKESKARRGIIINPETGEVTETNKRKSQRLSTVMNRSATVSRIVKDAQEKKARISRVFMDTSNTNNRILKSLKPNFVHRCKTSLWHAHWIWKKEM